MSRWNFPSDRDDPNAWTFATSDSLLDREVTVTVSAPWSPVNRKEGMDRAIVRLREWARLQYPSIVKLYDISSDQDRMVIVTDRHQGESLQTYLEDQGSEGRLEPGRLRELVINLGEALGYAHSHQVVHGELCPSQVILKTRGRVKLLRASPEVLDLWTGTWLSKMSLPTPAYYQSPSQMVGIKATFKDDIYAFGVLLYRLCVGGYPFEGQNFPSLVQQIVAHQLPTFEVSDEYGLPPILRTRGQATFVSPLFSDSKAAGDM